MKYRATQDGYPHPSDDRADIGEKKPIFLSDASKNQILSDYHNACENPITFDLKNGLSIDNAIKVMDGNNLGLQVLDLITTFSIDPAHSGRYRDSNVHWEINEAETEIGAHYDPFSPTDGVPGLVGHCGNDYLLPKIKRKLR